ncbi:MAG: molybdenum cofactor biosynthesis protein [Paracoccaceae bacterium]|nr:MAG: molybdenum cofactor biosynthesis protein [Paracoccaceae bacterium]
MKTASIIIIGNEILSGRTQDTNSSFLAKMLVERGISLQEIRVIPDDHRIIEDVVYKEASAKDYVFTSGGIGPTHDDITAEAIASCFDVPLSIREDAVELLAKNYQNGKKDLNEARLRMARIPKGAKLIENKISGAPGFIINNVFVMAGVPKIFEAMVQEIILGLGSKNPILSKTLKIFKTESEISERLRDYADKYKEISIGSYPFSNSGTFGVEIVIRHTNQILLNKVFNEILIDFNEPKTN